MGRNDGAGFIDAFCMRLPVEFRIYTVGIKNIDAVFIVQVITQPEYRTFLQLWI